MTPEQEAEMAGALTDKATGKQPSVSAQLVALAKGSASFIPGEDGQTYAVPNDGPGLAQPLRGEGSFRKHLAAAFYEQAGQVASQNALADALVVLEAQVDQADPRRVYQRVAPTPNGVLIDLGRPDLQMVEVTAKGWEVRQLAFGDPLLRRSRTMGQLPLPVAGGSLDPLWAILNVRLADRGVLIAWMVAGFLPTCAQPFILLNGEQGTGKTTAARLVLSVLDPGPGQMTSAPRTERDFGVAAQGRTVLGLDNLSTISPALSDTLCRAVTGESMVNRALYTDDGLAILTYRIGLIVTAIDPGALRGDLAERMLPIQLEPLGRRRRSEQELHEEFREVQPALLGALLDHVSTVLRHWDQAKAHEPEGGWPRMADFGRVLAALGIESGQSALDTYLQTTADNEMDVATGHPLAEAVLRLAKTGPHRFTAAALLHNATFNRTYSADEQRGWRTPQEMSQTLSRLTKSLRLLGVTVERSRSNGRRYIDISMTADTE